MVTVTGSGFASAQGPHPDPATALVLAIDSSAAAVGLALVRGDAVLARLDTPMRHGQAEAILPLLNSLAAGAGLALTQLQAVAVTVGPGSFTGIRVGLSVAHGLGLATGCPVIGIGSFAAVEAQDRTHTPAGTAPAATAPAATAPAARLVIIDSRRADLFAQPFAPDGTPLVPPQVLPVEALPGLAGSLRGTAGHLRIIGDSADAARPVLPAIAAATGLSPTAIEIAASGAPDPLTVARLAQRQMLGDRLTPATPLYIRPPDAIAPAHGGRHQRLVEE